MTFVENIEMSRYSGRSIGESYDWKLIILYLFLVFIGWANIYASVHGADVEGIFDFSANSGKQFIWMLTAFGLGATIIFLVNPNLWEGGAALFYVMVIGLLVAVIFLGVEVKGSRSWFAFGPVRFQPAEVSKITTSLLLAFVMSRATFRLTRFKDFLTVAFIIILPMVIILAEKETGSALVYVGFIFMLYREGLSGWLLAMIALAILIFILTLVASPYTAVLVLIGIISFCSALISRKIWQWLLIYAVGITALAFLPHFWTMLQELKGEEWPFLMNITPFMILLGVSGIALPLIIWHAMSSKNRVFSLVSVLTFLCGVGLVLSADVVFNKVLQDHQRKRIEVLLGMKEDPAGVGYNVNQSMIAIGSGGFAGKGYMNGTQTTYGFVPEQSTDFIFCTVGEEWGFVGCLIVIMLYVLLILQIIKDAEHSRESFIRIYGYCLAGCLFMHLFINVGMTIGIMPVIGIPLPFMSYGGSSLWAFTIMLSIFIALDHREKKYF